MLPRDRIIGQICVKLPVPPTFAFMGVVYNVIVESHCIASLLLFNFLVMKLMFKSHKL